ncbi:hypothetical protein BU649_11855 [Staphylococcus chromogenes]|uniref:hypothetical protein n=1 Tax=Staphylococcus chromogenes TaxID=46126 RepID=UPI000D1B48C9|nr:hypothetical protein [Staphylococcus chromogenes]PTG01253.1 hypothetical protein BU649_11855 [Staphylococcus chromogenes]PTG32035.1 hypothetical protein BU634_09420 [Staphylococcus chromogenes]RIM31728.1 hypothetical protein BU652_01800 [Staphylococcus chromogenes]
MEKILIDYAEFKRLVTQEIRLKEQIAAIEEDYEDLRLDYQRLEAKIFGMENELVEEDEE